MGLVLRSRRQRRAKCLAVAPGAWRSQRRNSAVIGDGPGWGQAMATEPGWCSRTCLCNSAGLCLIPAATLEPSASAHHERYPNLHNIIFRGALSCLVCLQTHTALHSVAGARQHPHFSAATSPLMSHTPPPFFTLHPLPLASPLSGCDIDGTHVMSALSRTRAKEADHEINKFE